MLLKKQTVWLLTMLSLVVVLSIYYITSPEQANDVATNEDGKQSDETTGPIEGQNTDGTIIEEASGDEVFALERYELDVMRAEKLEDLEAQVVSADTTEDVNAMKEEMENLEMVIYQEAILESEIKSMGFKDALVVAEDGKVYITVKGEKPSPSTANEIMVMVAKQFGQGFEPVAVEYTPGE